MIPSMSKFGDHALQERLNNFILIFLFVWTRRNISERNAMFFLCFSLSTWHKVRHKDGDPYISGHRAWRDQEGTAKETEIVASEAEWNQNNIWCWKTTKKVLHLNSKLSPGWCGSVDWAPACKPKGHWLDSQAGHMPGLQARSLVGDAQEATTHWGFLSLPSPLSKNK